MKISENFDLEEFVYSKTAEKQKIDNTPPPEAEQNIAYLVKNLLQPLRFRYSKPMNINSGYRSEELNRVVGGVANSQHLKGEAADVRCESPKTLLAVLKNSRLTFDQAILYSTFLHLSLRRVGENRNQVIIKMLIFVLFLFSSCNSTKKIYLQAKTEYIEEVVLKDTTIYIEIPKEVAATIAEDSSFLKTTLAISTASIDSKGKLHHTLEQKEQSLEKKVEYREKIITIRDSIPYPQVIVETKEVSHVPKIFWGSMILSIIFLIRIFIKFL